MGIEKSGKKIVDLSNALYSLVDVTLDGKKVSSFVNQLKLGFVSYQNEEALEWIASIEFDTLVTFENKTVTVYTVLIHNVPNMIDQAHNISKKYFTAGDDDVITNYNHNRTIAWSALKSVTKKSYTNHINTIFHTLSITRKWLH